ncbi:MAG: LysE family transporter [Candidatus Hydrothermarchaeota archaeon]
MEATHASLLPFLALVVFVSMSGVMMPGPVFAVTVAKGHKNWNSGFFVALGHAIIETPLIILIYIGFAKFFTSNILKIIISLGGGLMLIYMGTEMFKIRKQIERGEADLSYGSVAAGIITTGVNPYFFLWWATIGAALIIKTSLFGLLGIVLFIITHLSCDFVWYLLVSSTIYKSKRFWNERIHEIVFAGCSLILLIFGLWFIFSVFF